MKDPTERVEISSNESAASGRMSSFANDHLVWQPSIFLSISEQIENLGTRDCPVLIHGEAGTAKETLARQIHIHSSRCTKTFVPVNCRILRGQILESQLFGQAAGAGTVSLGAFRAADGGTLFLDEVDCLSLEAQSKVLRALQDCAVQPVGSQGSHPVNVRVISATEKDLRQAVQAEQFLADMYFRLNVATIALPPLRQRPDDIIILAKYFLEAHAQTYNDPPKKLLPSAMAALGRYNWPGNVRELANVMERTFISTKSAEISAADLPDEMLTAGIVPQENQNFPALDDVGKKLVIRAMEKTKGRKMAAAKLLKIDHRKLNRLLKKFELEPS